MEFPRLAPPDAPTTGLSQTLFLVHMALAYQMSTLQWDSTQATAISFVLCMGRGAEISGVFHKVCTCRDLQDVSEAY